MGFLKKAFKKATSYASGLLKPIDEYLGTDFAGIDERNAQIDENNTARKFQATQNQLTRDFNAQEAEKTRTFNAQQAEIERQWQEQMSNTAHQRAVADMQKAGLNPVLAAGAQASSNAGASATSAPATAGTSGTPTGTLPTTSARKMHRLEMDAIKTEIQATKANVAKTEAETYKTLIDAGYSEASIKKAEAERALLIQELENAKSAKEIMEAEKKIKDWQARHPLLDRMLPTASGITGGIIGGAGASALKNITWTKPRKIGFNR